MRNLIRTAGVTMGAFALVAGMTACSSGSETDTATGTGTDPSASAMAGPAKDEALAAMVPADIAADGVLTIGTDASYAPGEFIDADGTTVVGFTADLMDALGAVLGLDAQMNNAPFDSLVEGVKTGKYELGASSFTINAERQQQVDMPSYFNAGTSWAVAKGNPLGITPDEACGRRVAVQKATVQVPDIRPARRPAPRRARRPSPSSSSSCRVMSLRRSCPARTTRCWLTPRSWAMRSPRPTTRWN